MGILAILVGATLAIINPATQLNRATDSRRTSDLEQIKVALEQYYNDKGVYPTPGGTYGLPFGQSFAPYINQLPSDSSKQYTYESDSTGQWAAVYTQYKANSSATCSLTQIPTPTPGGSGFPCLPTNYTSTIGCIYLGPSTCAVTTPVPTLAYP